MSEPHMGPGPQDGEEYEEGSNIIHEDDEPVTKPEPKDPLQEKISGLEAQLATLTAAINSRATPTPAPKKPDPEPEPDWEELMFKDPKAAVGLIKEQITKQVSAQLTSDYQKDQGTKDFWNGFYTDHPDLKEDDDIVKSILNANLDTLAPMQVKAAGDKLAELTRARIMRYTGGKLPSGGKKAVTEGANSPTIKPKPPEKSEVVSLSDLIRARKAKRNKGTAA